MDSDKRIPIKKSRFDLFYILGISFLFLMVFIIFAPTKTITENIEISYSEQETYNVTEPHDVFEIYQEYEYEYSPFPGGVYVNCGMCICHQMLKLPMIYEGPDYYCDYCMCNVTHYRTVTKYLEIPKIRNVTKTRIESRPTEVNWIFGFKTPYTLHLPFMS